MDGVSDSVLLLCGLCEGGLSKGKMATAWPLEFCLEKSYSLTLALMPGTSVSPHMPLVPFQLLPHDGAQRELVYMSPKSVAGPLRGDA